MIVPWFGTIIPKTKCESTKKFAKQTCFSVSETNARRDLMRFLRSLRTINRDKQPKSTVVYLVEMGIFLVCQQSDLEISSKFFDFSLFLFSYCFYYFWYYKQDQKKIYYQKSYIQIICDFYIFTYLGSLDFILCHFFFFF